MTTVASLDHLGPFAATVQELAAAYDVMQGPDVDDPAQVTRPLEPTLELLGRGTDGLRIGVLGGWFRSMALPPALAAVDKVAAALGAARRRRLHLGRAGRVSRLLGGTGAPVSPGVAAAWVGSIPVSVERGGKVERARLRERAREKGGEQKKKPRALFDPRASRLPPRTRSFSAARLVTKVARLGL